MAVRLDRLATAIEALPKDRGELLMNNLEKIYSVKEAALLLKCNPETIRRAIRRGKLKAAKLGKDFRISKLDLIEYWRSVGGGELFCDT